MNHSKRSWYHWFISFTVSIVLLFNNLRSINCIATRNMTSFKKFAFNWDDVADLISHVIPPLSHDDHKGSMGRIGVIGGSREYTGAPFYAAQSSLKFGGDLTFVFCSKQASGPIKSYSPELMVVPFYDDEFVDGLKSHKYTNSVDEQETCALPDHIMDTMSRINTLVVGPGLGRNPVVLSNVKDMIRLAKSKNIGLVIDADGLWLLNSDLSLISGYTRCILTPNKAELSRLISAVKNVYESGIEAVTALKLNHFNHESLLIELNNNENEVLQIRALSLALNGVTILSKGKEDIITSGANVYILREFGSPRRCGGQGDVLAGCLGTALHWSLKRSTLLPALSSLFEEQAIIDPEGSVDDVCIFAAILAATVTRKASALAFREFGRSMTSPDIVNKVGPAFALISPHDYVSHK